MSGLYGSMEESELMDAQVGNEGGVHRNPGQFLTRLPQTQYLYIRPKQMDECCMERRNNDDDLMIIKSNSC